METEMEQILRLTYQMRDIGLGSAFLHQELTAHIIEGYRQFTIVAFPQIEGEWFKVLLSFNRDHEDGFIRLNEIKAYSRRQLPIEHQVINNIYTDNLENRIKDLDWNSFFKGQVNDAVLIAEHHDILNQLSELAIGNDKAGMDIQQKLMFKYWLSDSILADEQSSQYRFHFEREEVFYPGKDIFTVQLAANIFSGRRDDLFEKILFTDVERFDGVALKEKLNHILSKNPTEFDLVRWYSDKDGTAKVKFSISLNDGYYNIDTCTIDYKSFCNIPYVNLDEITDRTLEARMSKIDWNIPEVEQFGLMAKFQPEVLTVLNEIEEANAQKKVDACSITDLPTLKFWLGTPFENYIRQSAWNLLDSLPIQSRKFDPDTEIPIAINLLSGRAVAEQYILFTNEISGKWVRLDSTIDPNSGEDLKSITGLTTTEIDNILDKLPISGPGHETIVYQLLTGNLVEVQLLDSNDVLLESNPEQRTLNFYNLDGERIYINQHPVGQAIPSVHSVLKPVPLKKEIQSQSRRNGKNP